MGKVIPTMKSPTAVLLAQMQAQDMNFPVVSLFDAQAMGLVRLPPACDVGAQISRVFTPNRYPNTVVLRANQLWLDVDDVDIRRYLRSYLARPRWQGRSWDEISGHALLPESPDALFAREAQIVADITARLDKIARADAAIDQRVLDLYGIVEPTDRTRILGEAPADEATELEEIDETEEAPQALVE